MDSFLKMLTSTISKYVFAVPFLIFGLFHFMSADAMSDIVPIPGGVIWVYLTGIALVAAAVSIFIGKYTRLALLLLGLMLVLFVALMHAPGMGNADEAAAAAATGNALKDLALAGGAWILADRYE